MTAREITSTQHVLMHRSARSQKTCLNMNDLFTRVCCVQYTSAHSWQMRGDTVKHISRNKSRQLTLLGFACLVTNGWTQHNMAVFRTAHQHPEATLLQDILVVVVRVAHGPPAAMLLNVSAVRPVVNELTVSIWPENERVLHGYLNK